MITFDVRSVSLETEPCRIFLRHWSELPKTGLIPHSRAFLDAAPAALMPYVMIQELMPEGLLVRFYGTGLEKRWQHDLTGRFFAEHYPQPARERLRSNVSHLVSHPCGMHQMNGSTSSAGRKMLSELVVLPLAVDAGRPHRVVGFSQPMETLNVHEHGAQFVQTAVCEWFGIGDGTPTEPPHKG